MNEQFDQTSFLQMSGGAVLERFNYEMGKVLDNIFDPNTKATAKRKITITVEFIPSADRKTITSHTVAKCTLVPTEPITISLAVIGSPTSGEMMVVENTPQVPGQLALSGQEQERPKVLEFRRKQA